jgi:4-hydroxy-2-oxoheptanedioate aldolase
MEPIARTGLDGVTTKEHRIDTPQTPVNRLRAIWQEGRCALGANATIPSTQTVQVLARSGLDFILIDMEHGPLGPTEAHAMIAATAGTPLVPLARVAALTAWHAEFPLDLGALGICFPLISTRHDAGVAVRAIRYPPLVGFDRSLLQHGVAAALDGVKWDH